MIPSEPMNTAVNSTTQPARDPGKGTLALGVPILEVALSYANFFLEMF